MPKLFNRTIIKGGVSIMNFDLEKLPGDIVDTKITSIQLEANRTNISMYDAISFTGFGEDLDGDILDGDILIYTWDFGDGTKIVQGKKVSHSFHEAGIFNVSLKIEDTDGNNLTSNVQITVNPSPGTNTTNGDGSSTTGSSNLFGDNPTLVIGIILLIGIIIILIAIFIQIQHKKEEEELRLQEDETARRRAISRARRERRRREKEMEFVDREKRNVEQVNLIISDLHRSKLQQRREKKGKKTNTQE
jgi:hypothetical protein